MSERRPGSLDQTAVEIPEAVLAEHLARRAARPAPRALAGSIMTRVDETTPERRWRLTVAAWRPRMAVAASAVAFMLVAGVLFINAIPAPVGTDPRSHSPSPAGPSPEGPVWDPTVRALTPPEFLRVLTTDPSPGTVLIVDDQIVEPHARCPAVGSCPSARLENAGVDVSPPPGGHMPYDTTVIPGPLALQVGEGSALTFLGGVVSNGTRLEFTARDLAQRSAMGGLFVIPAWIHRGPVVPCASIVAPHAPLPTSELGLPAPEIETCSGGVYLTDTDPGPAPYGIGGGDPNAFPVQQEAYKRFASDPTADGTASRGVYLVRDWAGYGEILAGLQPIGIPAVDASAPRIGTVWNATERPLKPAELVRILAQQPPVGTVLIVDDEIVEGVKDCATPGACPDGTLVDTRVSVRAPVGGHLPLPGSGAVPGPLALQVTEGTHLVFLGSVARNGPTMDLTATDLSAGGKRDTLYVVPGWLWRKGPAACAPILTAPPPPPTSEVGLAAPPTDICAGANYLTDDAPHLPLTRSPSDGIEVQHRAYEDFAPSPDDIGTARLAVYLVRDWGGFGEVVTRLDPIQVPAAVVARPGPPTGPTSSPSPASHVMPVDEFVGRVLDGSLPAGSMVVADVPATAVTVLSPTAAGGPENPNQSRWAVAAGAGSVRVDGVAKDGITGVQAFLVEPSRAVRALGLVSMDGPAPAGLFLVHGWLRSGPAVPCPAPAAGHSPPVIGVSGQPLVWSQCPGMWIVPTAADPWAGPPDRVTAADGSGSMTTGDRSVLPDGTLHVQDDAGNLIDSGPKEGDWLVRLALANRCPPWAYCALVLADRPAPGVSWYELVGPVATPAPDSVEQRPPPTQAP